MKIVVLSSGNGFFRLCFEVKRQKSTLLNTNKSPSTEPFLDVVNEKKKELGSVTKKCRERG